MPRQVPDSVKQNRLHELMLTQQRIAFAANESRVGCRLLCLVDSLDKSQGGIAHGRFYGQAPDIDSLCIIKKTTARTGQFIDVKVVATHDYDLLVEQI
jgi:ribosomal protein S12 methylthiotransferase